MKIIGIAGVPGTGKTTLMMKLMCALTETGGEFIPAKSGTLYYSKHAELPIYILGVYDGSTFQGTDKLSMAVIGDAEKWLEKLSTEEHDAVVLFEGDRLWCHRWFHTILKIGADTLFLMLECAPEEFARRHEIRRLNEEEQPASFITSRRTKYYNFAKLYPMFSTYSNSNRADLSNTINDVISFLRNE